MECELAVEHINYVPIAPSSQQIRAEGNWDLCYQIQTPKVLPNKEINATSACQVQSKGLFVSAGSFQLGVLKTLLPNNLPSLNERIPNVVHTPGSSGQVIFLQQCVQAPGAAVPNFAT